MYTNNIYWDDSYAAGLDIEFSDSNLEVSNITAGYDYPSNQINFTLSIDENTEMIDISNYVDLVSGYYSVQLIFANLEYI